jgi:hypothetical protein
MADVGNELEPQVEPDSDQPSPSRITSTDQLDECVEPPPNPGESPTRTLHHQLPRIIIVDSNSDSDSSDDDGNPRLSHRDRQMSPPDTDVGDSNWTLATGMFTKLLSTSLVLIGMQGDQDQQSPEPQSSHYTVKFRGRAGEAIGESHEVGYTAYSRDLHDEDTPSEWAPFATRMEWELARWAKLRGPSSTAFSELLKIDGVCSLFISLVVF